MIAAAALIRPAPNLWLKLNPAPLTAQSESVGETFVAERIRISCGSRHPRLGLACSISARMPDTSGVAEDVPPKVLV